jgi:serine/threonine protein phosphatase PrpC
LPYAHILNNAVGGGDPQVRPEVESFELQPGDVVLLCTDGLTGMVTEEEIADILADAPSAAEACARLVARANQAGGRDNITPVVARY